MEKTSKMLKIKNIKTGKIDIVTQEQWDNDFKKADLQRRFEIVEQNATKDISFVPEELVGFKKKNN